MGHAHAAAAACRGAVRRAVGPASCYWPPRFTRAFARREQEQADQLPRPVSRRRVEVGGPLRKGCRFCGWADARLPTRAPLRVEAGGFRARGRGFLRSADGFPLPGCRFLGVAAGSLRQVNRLPPQVSGSLLEVDGFPLEVSGFLAEVSRLPAQGNDSPLSGNLPLLAGNGFPP